MHNLAAVLKESNRPEESLYRRSLSIKEKLLGKDSPDVARTRNNLGRLLSEVGRPSDAAPLLANAVEILVKCLVAEHPQLAAARKNLKAALAQIGSGLPVKAAANSAENSDQR